MPTDPTDLNKFPVPSDNLFVLQRNASDADRLINETGTIENRSGDTLQTYQALQQLIEDANSNAQVVQNTADIDTNAGNIQNNADAIAAIEASQGGNSRASTQVYRFVSGTSGGVAAGQIRGNTANPSTWTTITVHNDAGDTGSIRRDSIVSDFQIGSVIQVATLPEDTNGNVTSRIYSVSARSESSDIVTYTVSELGSGNLSLPSNEDNLIIQLVGYSLATQLDTSTSDNSSSRAASSSITNAINTTATNAASAASNAQSTANSAVSSIQQANVYLLTRNGAVTSISISSISSTITAEVARTGVGRYTVTGSFGAPQSYAVFTNLNVGSIASPNPTSTAALTALNSFQVRTFEFDTNGQQIDADLPDGGSVAINVWVD